MGPPHKFCEICNKEINVNERKSKIQNYHIERILKKLKNKNKIKENSYLNYQIDSSYGKAALTKIKSEYLNLLPTMGLHFDIPKDKVEEYFKNKGIGSIKKQIANSIGDDNFAIIEIVFGSLFMQVAMLGPKSKETLTNFLQKKEWDEQGLKGIKEKLQNTIIDFDFQVVKPKYAEIFHSKNKPNVTEKKIKEVLELSERKTDSSSSTENGGNYSTKTADQIVETLTQIAQKKEMQETTLIEFGEGLELKESFKKTNKFLEQTLKESVIEFKIEGFGLVDNKNTAQYLKRKSRFPNYDTKILIQGTKTRHAANSASNQFITGRDNWYGIGTYFTDQLDYATYYAGETKTYGEIPKIGDTFPIVGAEVFYDKNKFKQIYDYSYHKDFCHLPTEKDIQANIDKTIEKDGIHFIEVEGGETQVITKNRKILPKVGSSTPQSLPNNLYIGREYAVTDKTQILPLFALTMQRVEYCIIWRDNNFHDGIYKDYLEYRKKWIKEKTDFNLYIETSTEDALKLIWKKKYNKIILITNVGRNLEGKKYIDKARKILKFNAVALFFANSLRHLEWIKDYPNSLFTDYIDFFEKYILSFGQGPAKDEENLNKLKSEIEVFYSVRLKDLVKPVEYPLFGSAVVYGQLDCSKFEMEIKKETPKKTETTKKETPKKKETTKKENNSGCFIF